jgi:hypothetical protein
MASGFKELLFNLDERLMSPDHNRAQKFKGNDIAEMMRLMMNVSTATDDVDAGGVTTEYSVVESPLRAEIVNGFLVRPAVGSLSLAVDDGVMFALAPDSAADDSNYKYVRDPGVAAGGLLMTANASGSTRVDVIECQPTPINLESATRDVYNPATGLFAPTLLTKAVGDNMTYRVRMGTAGSGWPGTASGWHPLCVAVVPTSTTVNDTITFWDVRRLINDRAFADHNMSQTMPVVRKAQAYVDAISSAGQAHLAGFIEAEHKGRRIGGNMLRGSPGTDLAYVDLKDAANQEQSFATPANGFAWIYIAFLFGLPRWARYTDFGSGARLPRSPRGIPILSTTGPKHLVGDVNSSGIVIPTAWGFGAGQLTTAAFCVGGLPFLSSVAKDMVIGDGNESLSTNVLSVNATGGFTLGTQTFAFTENTHFPANAKTIFVEISLTVAMTTASITTCAPTVDINDGSNNGPAARKQIQSFTMSNPTGSGQNVQLVIVVELPVPTKWPSTTPGSFNVIHTLNNSGGGPTISGTPVAVVTGWRL